MVLQKNGLLNGEGVYMANVKKGVLTAAPQWWKHLRWAKRVFWKSERQAHKKEIDEDVNTMRVQMTRDEVGEILLWLMSYGFKPLPLDGDSILSVKHPHTGETYTVTTSSPHSYLYMDTSNDDLLAKWMRHKAGEHVDPTK